MIPDPTPTTKLRDIIKQQGKAVTEYPDRVESVLKTEFPTRGQEIDALVEAQRLGVPDDLLNASDLTSDYVADVIERLQQKTGWTAAVAKFTVEAWVYALSLTVKKIDTPAAAADPSVTQVQPAATGEPVAQQGPTEPQYWVEIGGTKYGPATADVLTQWANEGRISAMTPAEDAATARRMTVSQIPGVVLPAGGPSLGQGPSIYEQSPTATSTPVEGSNYYRGTVFQAQAEPEGIRKKMTVVIIKSIFATFCIGCCILGIISLVRALQANTALNNRNYPVAQEQLESADKMANASIIIGVILLVIRFGLVFLGVGGALGR